MFFKRITPKICSLLKISANIRKPNITLRIKSNLWRFYIDKNMSKNSNLLKPPDQVAGLGILNKSLFEKTVTVPCLIIRDAKISAVLPVVKKYLLKMPSFKSVQTEDRETVMYLNPETINNWSDFPQETRETLTALNINHSNIVQKSFTMTYDNYSVENVFRAVLPPDMEGMSSFTKIGHIVHVNLREHLIPYKQIIGEVLYDKTPNCRTVVNKTDIIDNTYRNFAMEVLKGDDDMLVQVKENKCTFQFDFSKVYWNSRLSTEHERIVEMIGAGDVVFDVFAGVGPFSIPLAKKKCRVFANDLNPDSYKWLNHNVKLNKVGSDYLKSYNKDGRDFILTDIKNLLPQFVENNVYIVMNLPALAVEFLDSFVGLFEQLDLKTPPKVIVYCFAKGEDYNTIAKNQLFKNIGWNIEDKVLNLFRVRTVSSMKEMMRITFKLDSDILCKSSAQKRKQTDHNNGESSLKKQCNGEKQEENQQRVQSCRSEEYKAESQGESCEK